MFIQMIHLNLQMKEENHTELKPDGNLVQFILNKVEHPYLPFITAKGEGLTKAGVSRLNRSIEAFVYCVLGAQVNTRSSIVGNSGSAQETQQEFLVLFESSIIENDITKSIQRWLFKRPK